MRTSGLFFQDFCFIQVIRFAQGILSPQIKEEDFLDQSFFDQSFCLDLMKMSVNPAGR